MHYKYIGCISSLNNIKSAERIMTPPTPDYIMSPNTVEKLNASLIQSYQTKVGSAIYAAISTRPDVALVVSMCAEHLLNPAMGHNVITYVLQYLVKKSKYGIIYDDTLSYSPDLNSEFLINKHLMKPMVIMKDVSPLRVS